MSSLRTALIVQVPEAEAAVADLRLQLDPVARLGVGAHFSILFPFVPASRVSNDVLARLTDLFRAERSFRHTLQHPDWFGTEVLWLNSTAADRFKQLTRSVWAAFPAYPPYEGIFGDDVVPHLTVADRALLQDMREAETQVRAQLPIQVDTHLVTLMAEQADCTWLATATFALGPGEGFG